MPIIAISRESFSGGEALAQAVAERLGYEYVGQETTVQAAVKAYGIPLEELSAAIGKRPPFFARITSDHTVALRYVRAALCDQVRAGRGHREGRPPRDSSLTTRSGEE